MRRRSSISIPVPIRIRIRSWALISLAVAGFAGALLTGCDRTISDDGSVLSESVW